jgi:hypothetical protein
MSNFTIDTDFNPGDEIKIVFDVSNQVPSNTDKTVYIVDLQEGTPHSVTVPLGGVSSEYYIVESENIHWSNVRNGTNADHFSGATSTFDGSYNTNKIINQEGHESSAAQVASDISRTVDGVTYDDWYLPTPVQLGNLYNLMSVLDPVIENQGGSKLRKDHEFAVVKNYWASRESTLPNYGATSVISMSFNPNSGGGGNFGRNKSHKFRVRAIRHQTTTDNVSVGDVFGGGVVFKIIESEEGVTANTDLDVTIGYNNTNIYSQDNLGSGYSNTGVELKITSAHGSNPKISFNYSNSNAGNYTWETNVKVFKKVEEIAEEVKLGSRATIAWSDAAKRWVSRYSFTPEYFSTHKTTFASFVKGQLYIHDDSNNKNYFYNGKYPTQISYVENVQPSQPKVFMTHSVEGNASPTISRFETIDNWTMNSDLNTNDYVRKEGTYYSEMFGDTNDPNVGENSTYGDRLMRGTKLRGQYIKVFMAFRQEDLEVKHSNIGFITSKGHTT